MTSDWESPSSTQHSGRFGGDGSNHQWWENPSSYTRKAALNTSSLENMWLFMDRRLKLCRCAIVLFISLNPSPCWIIKNAMCVYNHSRTWRVACTHCKFVESHVQCAVSKRVPDTPAPPPARLDTLPKKNSWQERDDQLLGSCPVHRTCDPPAPASPLKSTTS